MTGYTSNGWQEIEHRTFELVRKAGIPQTDKAGAVTCPIKHVAEVASNLKVPLVCGEKLAPGQLINALGFSPAKIPISQLGRGG